MKVCSARFGIQQRHAPVRAIGGDERQGRCPAPVQQRAGLVAATISLNCTTNGNHQNKGNGTQESDSKGTKDVLEGQGS